MNHYYRDPEKCNLPALNYRAADEVCRTASGKFSAIVTLRGYAEQVTIAPEFPGSGLLFARTEWF